MNIEKIIRHFKLTTIAIFTLIINIFYTSYIKAEPTLILNPVTSTEVGEGEDFATTVLNDPWDMDKRRDIGWEEKFSTVSVTDSIWSGTFSDTGGYFFPLFQGFKTALNASNEDICNIGAQKPIDASKYKQLSFKIYCSDRTSYAIYWTKQIDWPSGDNFFAKFDGIYLPAKAIKFEPGWHFYNFDMTAENGDSSENESGAWSGTIYGLRIDPSFGAPSGTEIKIDWIRLTDPSTSPQITFTWSLSGIDTSENTKISIFADTDSSNYNGIEIARGIENTGSTTIKSAVLSPGTYYFYLKAQEWSNYEITDIAKSNYSNAVKINGSPILKFTAPSRQSGDDYASTILANPWDMDSKEDIANLDNTKYADYQRQFSNPIFTDGIFQATADMPLSGNTETDAQLYLNVDQSNGIDTSIYRYITWRMKVDEDGYGDISDKVKNGWVIRWIWFNTTIDTDGSETKDNIIYEGWHTYSLDLWRSDILTTDNPFPKQLGWKGSTTWKNLRFDPLETSKQPTTFYIDYIKLTKENSTTGDYDIKFMVCDPEGDNVNITLYYDTDNTGHDGTEIVSMNSLPTNSDGSFSEHSYVWDTSTIPNGTYYIYASITDGINTCYYYSPVTIQVTEEGEPSTPTITKVEINDGRPYTMYTEIPLYSICTHKPTYYIASEKPDFSDTTWQPYAKTITFKLTPSLGTKTIYFKVKNALGESPVVSKSITLIEYVPALSSPYVYLLITILICITFGYRYQHKLKIQS